jgi:16S rRNA (cytosine1402-N4)-methyltransferase
MLDETLQWLAPKEGQQVVDLTTGLGGHGRRLAEAVGPQGRYIGFEWDPETFDRAQAVFKDLPQATLVNENFTHLPQVLAESGITAVDGVLLDAGVNWWQLTAEHRSLTQDSEAGLDMRLRPEPGRPTVAEVVAEATEEELREILQVTLATGESRRIARAICRARQQAAITTTRRLSEIILSTQSPTARRKGRQPAPALLAFRIYVNEELDNLKEGIRAAVRVLRPQTGRLVVLTFHSAEHRTVRTLYRELAGACQCPPRLPCVCGRPACLKILTPKPLSPDSRSLENSGPQCRSCRLHAAQAV